MKPSTERVWPSPLELCTPHSSNSLRQRGDSKSITFRIVARIREKEGSVSSLAIPSDIEPLDDDLRPLHVNNLDEAVGLDEKAVGCDVDQPLAELGFARRPQNGR
jgi:hypothetical protein